MSSVPQSASPTRKNVQDIFNQSVDQDFEVVVVEILGHDGTNLRRISVDSNGSLQSLEKDEASKITISGGVAYEAYAPVGSLQASAVWKAMATDLTTLVTTYADGDASYDNVATDLTALSYS